MHTITYHPYIYNQLGLIPTKTPLLPAFFLFFLNSCVSIHLSAYPREASMCVVQPVAESLARQSNTELQTVWLPPVYTYILRVPAPVLANNYFLLHTPHHTFTQKTCTYPGCVTSQQRVTCFQKEKLYYDRIIEDFNKFIH